LLDSQKSIECLATSPYGIGGAHERAWRGCLDLPVIGLAEHLDTAHRVWPVLASTVEVVESQRFLERRRIGLARECDQGQVVVPQVVPADQIGRIGQTSRVLVAGRLQQQGRREDGSGGQHDDVGGEGVR
jgi:hypothetical protein